ncbi:MAG TPA: DUF3499 domain-containing protein [Candidatus Brachybacterium merdavium]|uniref:DUF3499 domain-containing protein n=1 Tax=Candidatus Brachybacterium merdavium TaxID=2838513 RepID=A0A9D2RNI6_9MICO|nr:DUF3499 domain-containing protein [Candidatus Brachybacterium merdavium]
MPAYTPCVPARECSRTACSHPAVSTLTYVYEDSTAVLGPLSRSSEPHAYDLCRGHASSLTAPRGWELLRVPGSTDVSDDLVALSDAVDPRRRPPAPETPAAPAPRQRPAERQRPGDGRHLHVLRSSND